MQSAEMIEYVAVKIWSHVPDVRRDEFKKERWTADAGTSSIGERDGGRSGEALDGRLFREGRSALLAEVGAKGAEDLAGVGDDGHAPGSDEPEGLGKVTEFRPFFVGAEIGGDNHESSSSSGGAGAKVCVWFEAIDGCEIIRWKIRGRAVTKEAVLIEHENRDNRAGTREHFSGSNQLRKDFAARAARF